MLLFLLLSTALSQGLGWRSDTEAANSEAPATMTSVHREIPFGEAADDSGLQWSSFCQEVQYEGADCNTDLAAYGFSEGACPEKYSAAQCTQETMTSVEAFYRVDQSVCGNTTVLTVGCQYSYNYFSGGEVTICMHVEEKATASRDTETVPAYCYQVTFDSTTCTGAGTNFFHLGMVSECTCQNETAVLKTCTETEASAVADVTLPWTTDPDWNTCPTALNSTFHCCADASCWMATQYEKLANGQQCSVGRIQDIDTCQVAASDLGLAFSDETWNDKMDPPGCVFADDTRSTVYFNQALDATGTNPSYAEICTISTGSPTPMPTMESCDEEQHLFCSNTTHLCQENVCVDPNGALGLKIAFVFLATLALL